MMYCPGNYFDIIVINILIQFYATDMIIYHNNESTHFQRAMNSFKLEVFCQSADQLLLANINMLTSISKPAAT